MSLIVSTGDICDVDGLLALALYARSKADLLFIMNYPAYIGVQNGTPEKENDHGLGYTYDTTTFLNKSTPSSDSPNKKSYDTLIHNYESCSEDPQIKLKHILTDVAFHLTSTTWESGRNHTGEGQNFYFCIGGINDINPYSSNKCINEVYIYSPALEGMRQLASCDEDYLVDINMNPHNIDDILRQYGNVYMDFNGSAAFFNERWQKRLLGCIEQRRLEAFFIQGGVLAYEVPHTVPKIDGVINRLGCATMNQLYSPGKTGRLLSLMEKGSIKSFIVPNNSVENLHERWTLFMESNKINYTPLSEYTRLFYTSTYHIAQKPFDYYSAVALVEYVAEADLDLFSFPRTLFINPKYGVSILHDNEISWSIARKDYATNMRQKVVNENLDRESFEKEISILESTDCLVFNVSMILFELDPKVHLCLKASKPTLILITSIHKGIYKSSENALLIEDSEIRIPTPNETNWILHHMLKVTSMDDSNGRIVAKSTDFRIVNGMAILNLSIDSNEMVNLQKKCFDTIIDTHPFKKPILVKMELYQLSRINKKTKKLIEHYLYKTQI